ncbi:TlpA family protein disulfide reductase [Candidatus Ruminimicrobium bovinum]|uniref:TlpA family protein disulfide reductase n=1 Tax=Candidatus Ruminimicrobium bovinum TaxID=3242779 RepID=UPI0039B9C046
MKLFNKILSVVLFVMLMFTNIACAEQATNFELKDLSGKTVSLEDFKGKVVFVDFWATWCPPCRASIPAVEELYEKYKDNNDVCFLGINLSEDKDTVAKFVEKQGITYKILLSNNKVITDYGIRSIPAFFIIDKNGTVANKYLGYRQGLETNWQENIKALLD